MSKFNIFKSNRTTFETAALFLFILVLISNLAILRFTEGYFAFYDISMADIDYAPQMYDYLRIALPVVIASLVITVLMSGVMWAAIKAGDGMASLTKPGKRAVKFVKLHKRFFVWLSSFLGYIIKIGIILVSLWALWVGLYSLSASMGRSYAENSSRVTSISKAGENLQKIIIYKSNDELVLKTYNVSEKVFSSGYEVLYSTNYSARYIDL